MFGILFASHAVEEIRFTRELTDIKLTELNVTATFECELSKDGGLKVEWLKGDKKVRRDDRIDIVDDGKVHRLIIEKATAQDAGKYTATYEKLSTSASLTIAGRRRHQLRIGYCMA
jgi:hypothetical protein